MLEFLLFINLNKSLQDQPFPLHNRWHPDIPAVKIISPGYSIRVECFDCAGGQIKNNDDIQDIYDCDDTVCHPMSGPIGIHGAEPGDLLVVDIVDIGPLNSWGFTAVCPGEGLLPDYFKTIHKTIWDFNEHYATSRHIPGVQIKSMMHPGLLGVAPSHALLAQWNQREKELVETDPERNPPFALLPQEKGALVGNLSGDLANKVKQEGARTSPPRENGGNCDIKNLTKGSRIYFPVFVHGANLSVGDLHFCAGDGEIAFCGGIEMAGWIELKVNIIKNGMKKYRITSPIFETKQKTPLYTDYIHFEGISVDEKNRQHYMNARIAYQNACLNAMYYLTNFGYSMEQAYMLLSAAPCEGRINSIVNIPNVCATIAIPTEIFNFDIRLTK